MPSAFGSNYERESALDDKGWQDKAAQWTRPSRSAVWTAARGEAVVGLVAGSIDAADHKRCWLLSMWVCPSARQRGIARELIRHVIRWSESLALNEVCLHVTSNNVPAQRLYSSQGFQLTGRSIPHPHEAGLIELEMCQTL